MKKNIKIAMILSGVTLACAGIAYVTKCKYESNSKEDELLANLKRYDEYAGTSDMHVREVVAKDGSGKWVKKSSWADEGDNGSSVRELTDKEIQKFKKYLAREINYSVPFNNNEHSDKESFDVFSRIVFKNGNEYEIPTSFEF